MTFASMDKKQLADLDATLCAIRVIYKMRDCMAESALTETAERVAEGAAQRIGNGLNAEKLIALAKITE